LLALPHFTAVLADHVRGLWGVVVVHAAFELQESVKVFGLARAQFCEVEVGDDEAAGAVQQQNLKLQVAMNSAFSLELSVKRP
jgi:hypothetical protein